MCWCVPVCLCVCVPPCVYVPVCVYVCMIAPVWVCIYALLYLCVSVCVLCPGLQLCFASWLLLPTRKIVWKFFPCETLRIFGIFFYSWYWKMRKKIGTRATSVLHSFSLLGTLHSKTRDLKFISRSSSSFLRAPWCWMISLRLSAQWRSSCQPDSSATVRSN